MDEFFSGVELFEKELGIFFVVLNGFRSNEDIFKFGNKNIQLQSEFILILIVIDSENGKVEILYD